MESLPRVVQAVIAGKGELNINAHGFGMGCLTVRCPDTFGQIVYLWKRFWTTLPLVLG